MVRFKTSNWAIMKFDEYHNVGCFIHRSQNLQPKANYNAVMYWMQHSASEFQYFQRQNRVDDSMEHATNK